MKHLVLLCDGMADYPLKALDDKTPMTAAKKPNMNRIAKNGYIGLVRTVSEGFKPGSDVANLSVMGYDPKLYYTGRSPLEAASIGINMSKSDIAVRCNLVTLSDSDNYNEKIMLDYCADDISTEEAEELLLALKKEFDNEEFTLHKGVSYRHCMIWHHGNENPGDLIPPHDIIGQAVKNHLPDCSTAGKLLSMMEKSYDILKNHPVNIKRMKQGLHPANSIWLWGNGKSAKLPEFKVLNGLNGSVISAVDLIKGIGKLAAMNVIEVAGATGYIDTNFEGKADACIRAFEEGTDFVYLHVEAPDECGHRFEIANKVKSLEMIDSIILKPLLAYMEQSDDYKVMVLPDHATPLELRTHTSDPVPFLIYQKSKDKENTAFSVFDEKSAKESGDFIEHGPSLLKFMLDF